MSFYFDTENGEDISIKLPLNNTGYLRGTQKSSPMRVVNNLALSSATSYALQSKTIGGNSTTLNTGLEAGFESTMHSRGARVGAGRQAILNQIGSKRDGVTIPVTSNPVRGAKMSVPNEYMSMDLKQERSPMSRV